MDLRHRTGERDGPLFNHLSYHRGQITNMLRLLGATPSGVDFLVYCDECGHGRVID